MKITLLALAILASTAFAQELPPELKTISDKYTADLALIQQSKDAATTAAKKTYLSVLDSAEARATQGGKSDALKAILAEKESTNGDDTLTPIPGETLPKDLSYPRTTYIKELARISQAALPKVNQANSEYLRSLAILEQRAKAGNNQALLKNIEDEKIKLSEMPNASTKTGNNALLNSNFSNQFQDWVMAGKGTIETEDKTVFVRIKEGDISQRIDVPRGAKEVVARIKLRVAEKSNKGNVPIWFFQFKADGTRDHVETHQQPPTTSWKNYEIKAKIFAGEVSVALDVFVVPYSSVDIKEPVVEFHK
jgi:hypothetical protein